MSPRDPRFPNVLLAGGGGLLLSMLVAFAIAFWLRGHELDALHVELRAGELRDDSLEAANDTQRVHLLASLQVTERRAVQAEIARDSIGELLAIDLAARAEVDVDVDDIETEIRAPVTGLAEDSSVRVVEAEQQTESPPATVSLRALVWPDSASITLRVALAPIPLTAYVGCDSARNDGTVRPARIAIAGPAWADIELGELRTDPAVCSPAPPEISALERLRIQAPAFAIGAGAGAAAILILLIVLQT